MEEAGSSPSATPPKTRAAGAEGSPPPAEKDDLSRRGRSFRCVSNTSSVSSPSSSSSSSSCSSFSPPFTPPSPLLSPSSSVPFSWETLPGIPKPGPDNSKPADPALLPPPPPLRSKSHAFAVIRKKRAGGYKDPFSVALMECSKEEEEWQEVLPLKPDSKRVGRRGRWTIADRIGLGLGLARLSLDLYGSCKTNCPVADSAVSIPRRRRSSPGYTLLRRRTG